LFLKERIPIKPINEMIMKNVRLLAIAILAVLFAQCKDNEVFIDPIEPLSSFTNFKSPKEMLRSKSPRIQRFQGYAESGFKFTTEKGIIFDIPSKVFKNQLGFVVNGQIDIQVTEYMSKADMLYSGVTTTSGDQLLESGGMFNIQVSQNGEELTMGETSIDVFFPTEMKDEAMRSFSGESVIIKGDSIEQTDTIVDWEPRDSIDSGKDTTTNNPSRYYHVKLKWLSWCNLDKYLNTANGRKLRVIVPAAHALPNTLVHLILERKTVTYLYRELVAGSYSTYSYKLPMGEKVKVLAISILDDELYYNIADIIIDGSVPDIHVYEFTSMKKISEEDLDALIDGL
jgi:hypothetical protein